MEASSFVKTLKENWFVLVFIGTMIIQWTEARKDRAELAKDVSSLTLTISTLNKVVEEKIAKESSRLDEEDNGVRGDMERADVELHNDIKDLKELETMRERASSAELKVWVLQQK